MARRGQRFRYYVTHSKTIKDGPAPYRLNADELERHCTSLLAEYFASEVASIADNEHAMHLTRVLRDEPSDARRDIIVQDVSKVIIGDAELTIELASGAKLYRSLERVRHGNDARLIVGELSELDTPKADPQLIILLRDAHRAGVGRCQANLVTRPIGGKVWAIERAIQTAYSVELSLTGHRRRNNRSPSARPSYQSVLPASRWPPP